MHGLHRLTLLSVAALACGRGPGAAPLALRGPADSLMPGGPLGAAIRRGRALLLGTRDSLPGHVGNALRCTSCHLDAGRRPTGSLVGAYARYPQYRPRSATVETIEFRVNDCFRRSLNGSPLASDGPDMRDIVAYLSFLSRGLPVALAPPTPPAPPAPPALPALPAPPAAPARWSGFPADTAGGAEVYRAVCAKCHGPDGQGTPAAPPLWGPRSYNVGAGMARVRTAATFIRDNMPFDQPGTLTDRQAYDAAVYVNAHPRPDFPDKAHDWPHGDAPPDVAYPTLGAPRSKSPTP